MKHQPQLSIYCTVTLACLMATVMTAPDARAYSIGFLGGLIAYQDCLAGEKAYYECIGRGKKDPSVCNEEALNTHPGYELLGFRDCVLTTQ